MTLSAVAFPILPGKTADWHKFMAEINGPRRAEFVASRERVGAHERTYLQPTPMGDLVIVTFEAEDPGKAFAQMVHATDPFTLWFLEQVKALHGVDLTQPMPGGGLPSTQVADTAGVPTLAK
jgi:hypothetical protein